ncbi:MAG: RNA-binding S4 domain-containing protein, partial [Peptococcus niger]
FLNVSRRITRRTVAKDICTAGTVRVNDRVAKAGTEVAVGDRLEISLGEKTLSVKVLDLRETVRANEADELYQVIHQS